MFPRTFSFLLTLNNLGWLISVAFFYHWVRKKNEKCIWRYIFDKRAFVKGQNVSIGSGKRPSQNYNIVMIIKWKWMAHEESVKYCTQWIKFQINTISSKRHFLSSLELMKLKLHKSYNCVKWIIFYYTN